MEVAVKELAADGSTGYCFLTSWFWAEKWVTN